MSYSSALNAEPWKNQFVNGVNRLPSRATSYSYSNDADALSCDRDQARMETLNGTWKFHFAEDVSSAPVGFQTPGYDVSQWVDIEVPSCWENIPIQSILSPSNRLISPEIILWAHMSALLPFQRDGTKVMLSFISVVSIPDIRCG